MTIGLGLSRKGAWLVLAFLPLAAPAICGPAIAAAEAADMTAYQALAERDRAVLVTGYRLATANAPFCRDVENVAGMSLHHINQYGDGGAARAAFGFPADLAVLAIVSGGPADTSGIKAGDGITAIEGASTTPNPEALARIDEDQRYAPLAWALQKLALALADPPARLSVVHGQAGNPPAEVDIAAVSACASRFEVSPDTSFDASADGHLVSITSAMVDFMASPDELAAILAHELAHNILKHRERLEVAGIDRGLLQQFGRNARLTKATEIEADRLSIWLMANAGYDPQAAIRFWTRFGKQHGKGIFSAPTHYRWKKRVGLFEEEIAKLATAPRTDKGYLPPLMAAPPAPLD